MAKICPIMSRPTKATGVYDQETTEIEWVDCQKEKCELWTAVWTTENLQDYGCSLRMKVGINSEGRYVV